MQNTDETQGSRESMPAAEQQGERHAETRGVRLNRRRLVQGAAVGVVPAILTLRSGGVAALSACPGQVAGTATVDGDVGGTGEITNFAGEVRQNIASTEGDECFVSVTRCDNPDYVTDAQRPPGMGWVKKVNDKYYCTDGTSTGTYIPGTDQNIVILTGSSTVSLL